MAEESADIKAMRDILDRIRKALYREVNPEKRAALEFQYNDYREQIERRLVEEERRLEEEQRRAEAEAEERRHQERLEEERAAREEERAERETERQRTEAERQREEAERLAKEEREVGRLSDPEFMKKKRFAEKHGLDVTEEQLEKLSVEELKEHRHLKEGGWKGRAWKGTKGVGRGALAAGGAAVKHRGILFKIIAVILIIAILYIVFTTVVPMFAGTYLASVGLGGNIEAEVGMTEQLRSAKGFSNNLKQTITTGPTQAWNAQEINSELMVNENAGVAVHDLGAPMDFFIGDELVINGRLDAISTFPGQEVMLTLDIDPCKGLDPFCKTDAELKDGWTCELFGYEGADTFKVSDMSARRFTCTHAPITDLGEYELAGAEGEYLFKVFKLTFRLRHNTQAKVSKNLFVTDALTISMREDPAEYFGINPEETIAYPISDKKTIDLSMGLARVEKEEFLKRIFKKENPADAFIPAFEESSTNVDNQYLGVAFKSKSYSNDIHVNKLDLILPADPAISIISSGSQFEKAGEPFLRDGQYPKLQKYEGKEYTLGTVPAGESRVYYLKFAVDDDYLGPEENRVQYRQLTALAEIDYDYIHKETITLKVKKLPTE